LKDGRLEAVWEVPDVVLRARPPMEKPQLFGQEVPPVAIGPSPYTWDGRSYQGRSMPAFSSRATACRSWWQRGDPVPDAEGGRVLEVIPRLGSLRATRMRASSLLRARCQPSDPCRGRRRRSAT
jgi:hypothetical protein